MRHAQSAVICSVARNCPRGQGVEHHAPGITAAAPPGAMADRDGTPDREGVGLEGTDADREGTDADREGDADLNFSAHAAPPRAAVDTSPATSPAAQQTAAADAAAAQWAVAHGAAATAGKGSEQAAPAPGAGAEAEAKEAPGPAREASCRRVSCRSAAAEAHPLT